jgi:replicative DNA helicase
MNPLIPESEQLLCGALVIDPSKFDIVASIVTGADYADTDMGHFHDVLQSLHESGKPIGDIHLLAAEMKRLGVSEEIQRRDLMFKMFRDGGAAVPYIQWHAETIRKASILRRQISIFGQAQQKIEERHADPAEIAEWVDAQLRGAGHVDDQLVEMGPDIRTKLIKSLRNPEHRGRPVMMGIVDHDELVGGYFPGELVVHAARAGIGKTTLAMAMVEHNVSHGRHVMVVSLEMSSRELMQKLLCSRTGINERLIRSGKYQARDIDQIERETADIENWPLTIFAPYNATISKIRAIAKQQKASHGLDLLIVDHLGLVAPTDKKRQRHEQVAETSWGLKSLAKELKIPVVALAQLNRESEDQEPKLSHLRESGSIEQDADLVLFLHRNRQQPGDARAIVAKHRHGDVGAFTLKWDAEHRRYYGEDPGYAPDFVDFNNQGKQ